MEESKMRELEKLKSKYDEMISKNNGSGSNNNNNNNNCSNNNNNNNNKSHINNGSESQSKAKIEDFIAKHFDDNSYDYYYDNSRNNNNEEESDIDMDDDNDDYQIYSKALTDKVNHKDVKNILNINMNTSSSSSAVGGSSSSRGGGDRHLQLLETTQILPQNKEILNKIESNYSVIETSASDDEDFLQDSLQLSHK
jgi:hypothetical protein